jgi:hypothetical protein
MDSPGQGNPQVLASFFLAFFCWINFRNDVTLSVQGATEETGCENR